MSAAAVARVRPAPAKASKKVRRNPQRRDALLGKLLQSADGRAFIMGMRAEGMGSCVLWFSTFDVI